jgi:hypothetical protein
MKVLLRDNVSSRYLAASGVWTGDREQACDFHFTAEAVRRAIELGADNLEIICSFGEPRYDLVLEVGDVAPSPSPWLLI